MKKLIALLLIAFSSCVSTYYKVGDTVYIDNDNQGKIIKIKPFKNIIYIDTSSMYNKSDGIWVIPFDVWYIDSLNYY